MGIIHGYLNPANNVRYCNIGIAYLHKYPGNFQVARLPNDGDTFYPGSPEVVILALGPASVMVGDGRMTISRQQLPLLVVPILTVHWTITNLGSNLGYMLLNLGTLSSPQNIGRLRLIMY